MAEMKAGYKKTDIGLIPEDWDIKLLDSLGNFAKGAGIKKDEAQSGNIPCIRYGELYTKHHDIIRSFHSFISEEVSKSSKKLKCGDILFACSGETKEEIGKCASFLGEGLAYAGGDIIILSPHSDNSEFLGYLLNSNKIAQQKASLGQGDTVVHINAKALASILVVIPQPEEQKAIAAALSDVDGLIESLEQLLAKKRDMKTAAMQQLLTGKKRLPGFDGKWKEKNMAQDSYLKARIGWQGLTTAEYLETGKYILITGTDFKNGKVDWSNCCYVEQERYDQDKNIQVNIGDILLTKDGTIGKVAYVDQLPEPATLNSGVFVIRPINQSYYPLYFYYVLRSEIFAEFLNKLQAGSTINHLYQKDFVHFSFMAPPISEQKAIAQILYDMDSEIDALEQRLGKARSLKTGMMQALLTGKTRLIKTDRAKEMTE